jgi:hypothetical protein
MKADDRFLKEWYGKIERGEIKLPRFQRFGAWDRSRISSLVETVIQDLPLGSTLVLEVGDREKFVSRYLETAPHSESRVLEQLLDGQQRLTAFWRVLHNNYERETYFIYVKAFDKTTTGSRDDMTVFLQARYPSKTGDRRPAWCDRPADCLHRGLIPTALLKPVVMQREIDEWVEEATKGLLPTDDVAKLREFFNYQKAVSDKIRDLRDIVAGYNLPYLSLPADTDKKVALKVFINMNTNSKPLDTYDIIVAEVEGAMGASLHDLLDAMESEDPNISQYEEPSNLILWTSALLQNARPDDTGAWDMDKRKMVENWDAMKRGLSRMALFLKNEGIPDGQRLPTNAILAVIAALYSVIPEAGDERGMDELLLKKYVWHSFFTDRYENSASTAAHADFVALRKAIAGKATPDLIANVPIFRDHSFVEPAELLAAPWPKRMTIPGRAILAVACRLGALDFATGEPLTDDNIHERQYHHLYPDALLAEVDIDSYLALNCALIKDKTNYSIGRKDPVEYMRDRYEWTSEEVVRERLESHLIPVPELANGGYEGLSDEEKKDKLSRDFVGFLRRRAELVIKAARLLAEGRQLSATDLFRSPSGRAPGTTEDS